MIEESLRDLSSLEEKFRSHRPAGAMLVLKHLINLMATRKSNGNKKTLTESTVGRRTFVRVGKSVRCQRNH